MKTAVPQQEAIAIDLVGDEVVLTQYDPDTQENSTLHVHRKNVASLVGALREIVRKKSVVTP